MTTHELANLLEHLKAGLGSAFKADGSKAFEEASAAFRELPDQPLKKLAEQLRNANAGPATGRRTKAPTVDVAELIDQIRGVRNGATASEELKSRLGSLTNAHCREILSTFNEKATTRVDGNRDRVMKLLAPQLNGEAPPAALSDQRAIEDGVSLFTRLRDTRGMSITDVRAAFEPLRAYAKPVLEEISRRVGYTPIGSREDILNRLLSNLEGIKMNQQRVDSILN